MKTTSYVVATVALVAAGRWAQDKPITPRLAIGGVAFAIGLSLIGNASERLAQQFAALVLVFALFTNVPALARSTGLIEERRRR